MFFTFRFVHKNFVGKLKIVIKNSEKLNYFYGEFSHDLKYLNSSMKGLAKFLNSLQKVNLVSFLGFPAILASLNGNLIMSQLVNGMQMQVVGRQ